MTTFFLLFLYTSHFYLLKEYVHFMILLQNTLLLCELPADLVCDLERKLLSYTLFHLLSFFSTFVLRIHGPSFFVLKFFYVSVRSGKVHTWILAARLRRCTGGNESPWTRTLVLWALAIFIFLKPPIYNEYIIYIIDLVVLFKSHWTFSCNSIFGLMLYEWKA